MLVFSGGVSELQVAAETNSVAAFKSLVHIQIPYMLFCLFYLALTTYLVDFRITQFSGEH